MTTAFQIHGNSPVFKKTKLRPPICFCFERKARAHHAQLKASQLTLQSRDENKRVTQISLPPIPKTLRLQEYRAVRRRRKRSEIHLGSHSRLGQDLLPWPDRTPFTSPLPREGRLPSAGCGVIPRKWRPAPPMAIDIQPRPLPQGRKFLAAAFIKCRQTTSIQREKMVATLYKAAIEFDAAQTWKSWQKMKKGFHGKA